MAAIHGIRVESAHLMGVVHDVLMVVGRSLAYETVLTRDIVVR